MTKSRVAEQSAVPYRREGFEKSFYAAIKGFDLEANPSWIPLKEMSDDTVLDGLAAFEETAVVEQGRNFAAGTVYVTLRYGSGPSLVAFNEAFPARFYFEDDGSNVSISKIEIDTSPFIAR